MDQVSGGGGYQAVTVHEVYGRWQEVPATHQGGVEVDRGYYGIFFEMGG